MIYIPYSQANATPPAQLAGGTPVSNPAPPMPAATTPLQNMRQFIAQSIALHDKDKDGEISLDEALNGPGLTGEKKSTYSIEDGQALWASISGPSGTLSTRDYAQYLLYLDADGNGTLTEPEVATQKQRLIQNTQASMATGVVKNYTHLIDVAMQKGLDVELPKEDEQRYAMEYAASRGSAPELARSQATPISGTIASLSQPIPSSNAHEISTQQFLNLMSQIGRIGDLSTLPPRNTVRQTPPPANNTRVQANATGFMNQGNETGAQTMLQFILLVLMGLYRFNNDSNNP